MKIIFVVFMVFTSNAFAKKDAEWFRKNNEAIERCTDLVANYFQGVKLERDYYYRGQNKKGACFIGVSYGEYGDSSQIGIFLNSKENTKYVANVEISESDIDSLTGIVSELKECSLVDGRLKIVSIYTMPTFLSIMGDGTVRRRSTIFDPRDREEMQFTKNQSGKIVSAVIKTKLGGKLNCSF